MRNTGTMYSNQIKKFEICITDVKPQSPATKTLWHNTTIPVLKQNQTEPWASGTSVREFYCTEFGHRPTLPRCVN